MVKPKTNFWLFIFERVFKNLFKSLKNNKLMMSLKAFLLCAGKGTRFSPYTLTLPKPLIPFLNIPLCAYNLYLLKTLKVQDIVLNTHVHPHLLKKEVGILAQKANIPPPVFSFEETLLGSAGGLFKVRDFFKSRDPFFYLNGDSFIWPETDNILLDFYSSHVQSGALCSFLVRPACEVSSIGKSSLQKGYIYAKGESIVSFSNFRNNTKAKPYEWSGLALFSPLIFNEIGQARNLHIFKDVLEPFITRSSHKGQLRIHSVPHLKLLDMNQLSSYLQGTKIALEFLRKKRQTGFLKKALDLYTPDWQRYEGENWFSATPLKNPPPQTADILLCGPEVKGLNHLLVKDFAVIGERVVIHSPVLIQQSVLGKKASLNTHLKNTLRL